MLTLLSSCLLPLSIATPGDGCSAEASLATARAGSPDLVETAASAGSFDTLVAAIEAAGLVDVLKGEGPYTVFAPTDEAFAALPDGTLDSLLEPENRATLRAILAYHVVPGEVSAAEVVELSSADTLNGQRLDVAVAGDTVSVDGATVTKTDIRCSNGIVHVIDSVVLPSTRDVVATAAAADGFDTLTRAIRAAGLVEALEGEGPFTVFAPTDEAFAALPEGTLASLLEPENREKLASILKLHVVKGRVFSDAAAKGATVKALSGGELVTESREGAVLVNGARVVSADVDAANGVIHVIDEVLLP